MLGSARGKKNRVQGQKSYLPGRRPKVGPPLRGRGKLEAAYLGKNLLHVPASSHCGAKFLAHHEELPVRTSNQVTLPGLSGGGGGGAQT
ncbi:hypothetical protein GDO81_007760 [Engystomops pustulosus]|uniref:Histone H2A n=1 Tax=Engystomops pustulosus TaxID=76066 RepID=A0AAV7C9P9_ENGPU|nr:hypothetical protein GDO81_007760 [Engystomops pustulosus]